jgi:hypothetical protein
MLQQKLGDKEIPKEEETEREIPQRSQGRPVIEPDVFGDIMKSPVTKTIARELTRGLLGVLGLSTSTRRRTSSSRKNGFPF